MFTPRVLPSFLFNCSFASLFSPCLSKLARHGPLRSKEPSESEEGRGKALGWKRTKPHLTVLWQWRRSVCRPAVPQPGCACSLPQREAGGWGSRPRPGTWVMAEPAQVRGRACPALSPAALPVAKPLGSPRSKLPPVLLRPSPSLGATATEGYRTSSCSLGRGNNSPVVILEKLLVDGMGQGETGRHQPDNRDAQHSFC